MSGSETRRASYKKDRYSRYSEIPFSSREIAKTLWIRAADECSNGNQAKLTNTRLNSSPARRTSHHPSIFIKTAVFTKRSLVSPSYRRSIDHFRRPPLAVPHEEGRTVRRIANDKELESEEQAKKEEKEKKVTNEGETKGRGARAQTAQRGCS